MLQLVKLLKKVQWLVVVGSDDDLFLLPASQEQMFKFA